MHRRDLVLFQNKEKNISVSTSAIGQNDLKNMGISDICKNQISCIPNLKWYALKKVIVNRAAFEEF